MEVNARKSSPLPETGKRSDKYATIGITRGVSIRSNFRNDFRTVQSCTQEYYKSTNACTIHVFPVEVLEPF